MLYRIVGKLSATRTEPFGYERAAGFEEYLGTHDDAWARLQYIWEANSYRLFALWLEPVSE
jgi:hypothetical protein